MPVWRYISAPVERVTDQAPVRRALARRVDGRQRVARRERDNLFAPADEESVGADQKRASSNLRESRKRGVNFFSGTGIQNIELQPERPCRIPHLSRFVLGKGSIGRVREERDDRDVWHQFVQQF